MTPSVPMTLADRLQEAPPPRCIATRPGVFDESKTIQCRQPARFGGKWCRNHAQSLGGYVLCSPEVVRERARLREALERIVAYDGPLPCAQAVRFWRDASEALIASDYYASRAALSQPSPSSEEAPAP